MKISQTNNQLEIKNSGLGSIILGVVFVVVGIIMTIVMLSGSATDENGESAPAWAVLFGVVFAVVGCLVAWFAKSKKTVLQQGANTTVSAKRVLSGKTSEQTFPTANITAVQLHTYINNTGNDTSNRSRRSTLSLLLNNNDVVELGSANSNGISLNGMNISNLIRKAPLSKEANQIASFLGVPLQNSDVSSITGAVQSIKQGFGGNNPGQQTPTTVSQNQAPNPTQPAQPTQPQGQPQPNPQPQPGPTPPSPPQPNPSPQPQPQQTNQPVPPPQNPPSNQPPANQ